MHWLLVLLVALSLWGGWNWWNHERRVSHPPGIVVEAGPVIRAGETRAPWQDDKGFRYASLGAFEGRAMVLARRNYDLGEFAALAPTDLALGWGELSDPRIVDQLAFPQMKSFSSRFVVPEFRRGSKAAMTPAARLGAVPLAHARHDSSDPDIRRTLAGIRPGQVIRFEGTLVLAVAPSGGRYESSLALGDRNCEIAWIDDLELE
ncbi:MAG: hypothetical protein IPG84_13710 [Betaproteobacteria bacterium]|nr:hypothetical protein [Betaproteobacteria bacterium]